MSMNFIERLFGIAPDARNGSTEAIILAMIALVAAALLRDGFTLRSPVAEED
jgi:hypothetical protein